MARKTYNEKLNNSGYLAKIESIEYDNKMDKRFGCSKMIIGSPLE